jgi:hypothetical protein
MSSSEITPVREPSGSADAQVQRLADELYRERVADARAMPLDEKLLAGEELFYYACAITLAGIRDQLPGLSEQEHLCILEARLLLRERMEEGR